MSLKNKGFMYYEIIISIAILIVISSFLISMTCNLSVNIENQKLTYNMKQNLYLNVVLLEDNKELLNDSSYVLHLNNDKLCIIWRDLYGEEKTICEKVWI